MNASDFGVRSCRSGGTKYTGNSSLRTEAYSTRRLRFTSSSELIVYVYCLHVLFMNAFQYCSVSVIDIFCLYMYVW